MTVACPQTEVMAATGRPGRLAMLAAHEPTADPRIDWEMASAAKHFDVTVFGLYDAVRPEPRDSKHGGVRIVRLTRRRDVERGAAQALIKALWSRALVKSPISGVIVASVMTVFLGLAALTKQDGDAEMSGATPARQGSGTRGGSLKARRLVGRIARGLKLFRFALFLWQLRHVAQSTVILLTGLRREKARFNIVHCNDLETLLAGIAYKDENGARLVYDAHEFYPHSFPEGGAEMRWFFSVFEAALIDDADQVLTVNPLMADQMSKAYGLKDVKSVLNAEPYVGGRSFAPDADMDRLGAGRVRFLFQGKFAPSRGLEELVTVWDRTPSDNAVLFLRGPDDRHKDKLAALCRTLGEFERTIFFLPAVAEEELVGAAAAADVGIIPYKPVSLNNRYACPNKLSQYLHAGLMILTNDLAFTAQVVRDYDVGLVCNFDNHDSLARALNIAASDADKRETCRTNAARTARDDFNWQNVEPILLAAYGVTD